jgi:N-acyl-D-amino-acid deacylase
MLSAHIRNESELVIEAVKEFIDVVKASGARGVISHHKAAYKSNHGKTKVTLKMIEDANRDGCDIYCDVYPYIASSTSLSARFIPKEYRANDKTLEHLKDPDTRKLIHDFSKNLGSTKLDWVLVTHAKGHPEFEGKYVSEIARELGCDDIESALRIIEATNVSASACYFSMCEEDVERVISFPRSMICTDSSVVKSASKYHPRLRASFPRAIAKYVRERGVVSLSEMIRKMTSLPAKVYDLASKGLIKIGYDADICIFDYERIQDKATFVDPTPRAEGLNYVIISGKVVCENAIYNGTRAAKLIKR